MRQTSKSINGYVCILTNKLQALLDDSSLTLHDHFVWGTLRTPTFITYKNCTDEIHT